MTLSGPRASFSSVSNTAFVLAVIVYLGAVAVHFAIFAWNSRRIRSAAIVVTGAGAACHLVALVTRAMAAGRPPWGDMYEFSMSSSFVMVLAYLVASARIDTSLVGGFVLSAVAVWMGVGWVLYAEPGPLQPALRSNWLIIHVFLVMSGAGILLFASIVSALYLVRLSWEKKHGLLHLSPALIEDEIPERVVESEAPDNPSSEECLRRADSFGGEALDGEGPRSPEKSDSGELSVSSNQSGAEDSQREAGETLGLPTGEGGYARPEVSARLAVSPRPEGPGAMSANAVFEGDSDISASIIGRLPSSDKLDRLAYRLVMVAFPIWTLGVIAGAIWGEQAWGRYWGWDPKEVWSFIVWMIFATYLHARATRGWRGKGAAILAMVGGAAIIFNTFAVNLWISGLHSYAGV